MLIRKWDHNKEEGIYRKSIPVEHYSRIKNTAEKIVSWLNENNGNLPEPYKEAYALSHCQLEAYPFHFFVVTNKLLRANNPERSKKDTDTNFYFPSQIIVNAHILQVPEKIKVNVPERSFANVGGKMIPKIIIKEKMERNTMDVPEACFSFPYRSQKTMERHYRVKVFYQYPVKILWFSFLRSRTEWVEALKAHIFQHEIEHANAQNIYFQNE